MNSPDSGNTLCYLCLVCSVVASLSITQKVASSNNLFNYKYFIQGIQ